MQTEGRLSSKIVAVIVVVASLTGGASAGCSACGGGSTWMGGSSMGISWAEQTLETGTTTSAGSSSSAGTSAAADGEEVDGSASAISPEALFIDQNGERRLVAAFVGVPGEASYIEGSIHLPLDQVFNAYDSLKSPDEIAALFEAAGISENEPIVTYGDFFNQDGTLKSPDEIAALFEAAGISENEPIVTYGDFFNQDGTLKSPDEIAALFEAAGISENEPIVTYGDFFNQDGTLKSPDEIAALFEAAGISENEPIVTYGDFFNQAGTLKSPAEIAAIFGAAGIAETDPLVIYGDSFVNGYDTFAFWVMSYLGHEEVLLLEGTRADREAAGLEFVSAPAVRAAVAYNSTPNLGLLTVESELADEQLVDPRTPAEFSAGHLDGAINVDSTTVIGIDGLASDSALAQAFSGLEKDEPVVVYSSRGGVASIVWYALFDQGFVPGIMIVG
ncbi:MAG TPA: rhodanese-like domain-containing protein [Methanothrix sp.]|nr:rhodanese-like domain-containing protein [Methanothrix sp.]